jgi:hypothetical protein
LLGLGFRVRVRIRVRVKVRVRAGRAEQCNDDHLLALFVYSDNRFVDTIWESSRDRVAINGRCVVT